MKNRLDVLVCYDVETVSKEGRTRLRKMAKACSSFGQRVQYSVFELRVTPMMLEKFVRRAVDIMDQEKDSVRMYKLNGDREDCVKVYGRDGWTDYDAPLVV